MRCFYHGEVEAVAICKSCGRGVCHDCGAEVGTGTACRNRCEPEVEALNELIQRNKKAYASTAGMYRGGGAFSVLVGVLFAGFGWFMRETGSFSYFIIALGVIFFLRGVSQFFAARRWREK